MIKKSAILINKPKVTFFQRKPRTAFDFSLEFIFNDIRNRLQDRIEATVKISTHPNNGLYTKIYNLIEAGLRQSNAVNHVTGEIHFITLLMSKKSVILTILDCGMMFRKKGLSRLFVKLLYLTWPVKSSTYITAISEVTKQEIIKYTNCASDKIFVIPVAVDSIYQPYPKPFNGSKPTILHIGVGYNKNIFRLIEALAGIECHLVIVGKLNDEHTDALTKYSISFSNSYNLTQAELLQKYYECDILSFVSTFEGFGMPIVEANAVERVVVTSNVASMPEVAGNAAHLVNPYDVIDIRNGILKVTGDQAYREKLISNGRKNKARFDPDKIADQYYELYCRIWPSL